MSTTALPSVEDMEKAADLVRQVMTAIEKAANELPRSFDSSHTRSELLDMRVELAKLREKLLFNIKYGGAKFVQKYATESEPRKLESFNYMGKLYEVDWSLKQFRSSQYPAEIVKMDSPQGEKMMSVYEGEKEALRRKRTRMRPEDLASRGI